MAAPSRNPPASWERAQGASRRLAGRTGAPPVVHPEPHSRFPADGLLDDACVPGRQLLRRGVGGEIGKENGTLETQMVASVAGGPAENGHDGGIGLLLKQADGGRCSGEAAEDRDEDGLARQHVLVDQDRDCLLYTSDAADDLLCV